MATDYRSREEILSENASLRLRLEEAEETLRAIQSGEVDALIVSLPKGEQVFTLEGAEHLYRILVETINEGAAFLSSDGVIVYCNRRLSDMLHVPMEKLIGSPLVAYVASEDQALVSGRFPTNTDELSRHSGGEQIPPTPLFQRGVGGIYCRNDGVFLNSTTLPPTHKGGQDEITLQTATGNRLPVLLSSSAVDLTGKPGLSVVLTDISTRKQAERKILHLNRLYAMSSAVNNTISQGKDRDTLFREFCRIAVELGGFRLAWVGLLDPETGCVNRAAATGETGYLDDLSVTIKDGPEGMTPTGKVVREGTIFLCNDFLHAEITRPWHEIARIHGLLASASVAIKENKVVIGAFSLYASEQDYFDDQQIGLLQQMGSDLSFALDNLSQRARLREAERQVTIAAERESTSAIIHEKERLLSESQRISHIGSWSFDFSNPMIWTEETYRLYAVSPETFIPTVESLIDLIHPDDLPLMLSWIEACATGGNPGEFEFRHLLPDGTVRYLSACGELMRSVDGKAIRMVGTVQDITERKQTEIRLKLAASVFSHSREGILITDASGNILQVNDACIYITGYPREEALGQNPRILKSSCLGSEFYAALWHDLNTKGYWHGEILNRRKNGEEYTQLTSISAVLDNQGQTQNYIALFSDITLMKRHQQQLEYLAHYDSLTSLPNRLLLADRLEQAMAQTQRRGSSLALAYLDLDGFKEVNDEHGHVVGDALLIALSQRMKAAVREVDTVARIGGDEFVVLMVDLENPKDCEPLLERILQVTANIVTVGQASLRVSASIGVTIYPLDKVNSGQLLRHADQSMYFAKQLGKNRYALFDVNQDAAMKAEQENLAGIRRALDRREFVLHYQPKVNLKTCAVIGAEALIRWQHPQRSLLPPSEFMPIVENHIYGIQLGEWVIDEAFGQLDEWHRLDFDIPVSVNISAYHLQADSFVQQLRERFATHPTVRPEHFEMEVLESSALEDMNHASQIMQACCGIGVSFALDDFGTGYSSLTYLKRLPVDILKIDQSFIRDMLNDPEDLSIIEGVIGLAKAFNRQVIAEGVETVAHCVRLLELGCDLAQGYAIAMPMPGTELPDWVASWKKNWPDRCLIA